MRDRSAATATPGHEQLRANPGALRRRYAEMLGHNADFGHIHAVNMSQQTNLIAKRVGRARHFLDTS